jgi:hypothetical protein
MKKRLNVEELFREIVEVVLGEFSDVATNTQLRRTSSGAIERLRMFLKDGSFVDVWLSAFGKYSYHWQHRHVSGMIYRYNNAPHCRWKHVKTFPKHFHDGSEGNVKESTISDKPVEAVRELSFIKSKLETGS